MNALRPEELRRARGALGLTQAHVGACVGVSAMTVSRWEQGEAVPSAWQRRILGALLAASARPDAERIGATIAAGRSELEALYHLLGAALAPSTCEVSSL